MKAMRLAALGDDQPFELFDKDERAPGPGEVAIAVHATSVNPVDTKIRAGAAAIAPEDPIVLGCDVAGVIEAVGPGAARFNVGDRVFGCAGGVKGRDGAYAERMIADERLLAPAPSSLSMREAAALPLVGITAWEALVDRAAVQPGETVLVHGGAGGVGHMGVQLGKALGAIVHTTVSSDEKAEIAMSLGADRAIRYKEKSVADYVAEETGGAGYPVVFDTAGGPNLPASLEAVAINGRVSAIVSMDSAPDLTPLHVKNAALHVVFMLIPMLTDSGLERHGAILERLARLTEAGRLRPLLDKHRFKLEEVGAAHAHLKSGDAVGKVVIDVAEA
ncbi:MAG: zinc-dependent alcohol dehydrogenase family protein [Pseudomonadota bacterium]